MAVGGQCHIPPAYPTGKDPFSIVHETGWAPEPVWTGAENLAPLTEVYPRIVQPVASCYTDWAIPANCSVRNILIYAFSG
jgi:hypothetical protein